jgi:Na+/H+ antiporter NhaD/arsenite permease-like protein
LHLPLQQISQCFRRITKDKPIYILCGSGERATVAASVGMISSFMQNIGAVALFLPVAKKLGKTRQ